MVKGEVCLRWRRRTDVWHVWHAAIVLGSTPVIGPLTAHVDNKELLICCVDEKRNERDQMVKMRIYGSRFRRR